MRANGAAACMYLPQNSVCQYTFSVRQRYGSVRYTPSVFTTWFSKQLRRRPPT